MVELDDTELEKVGGGQNPSLGFLHLVLGGVGQLLIRAAPNAASRSTLLRRISSPISLMTGVFA